MKKNTKLAKLDARFAYMIIIPIVLIILLIRGYPLVVSLMNSFTDWDGLKDPNFIGFKNYTDLLTGSNFWLLMKNSAIFLIYIPFQIVLGIMFALYIFEKAYCYKIFRVLFYTPQVISMVIIGYLFATFFAFDGPINNIFKGLGLSGLAVDWFAKPQTSMPLIIFCLVWMNIGWQALIFSGGLSSIDTSVFEAATLDGASYFKRLFKIILPLIGRSVEYSVITCVIWVFSALFPIIFTMTNGGPAYKTTTIDFMIYVMSFRQGRFGMACALSVILAIIMLIITRIEYYVSDKVNSWQ